ncbi:MAG: hypothetical protein GXX79_10315 [Actinomycetales bacterium]|nr:hypothetical protein [Actinomycetales bacterium]
MTGTDDDQKTGRSPRSRYYLVAAVLVTVGVIAFGVAAMAPSLQGDPDGTGGALGGALRLTGYAAILGTAACLARATRR